MKILCKLLFCFFLATALPALAIGFGQSSLHSSLGEPLKISVKILSAEEDSDDNLRFRTAEKDMFKRMKIPYQFEYMNLQFRLERDQKNHATLFISSSETFDEPLAHFIVEMTSPQGKQFKEIVAFLELPEK